MAFNPGEIVGDHRKVAHAIINKRDITLLAGDYEISEPLPPIQSGTRIRGTPPGTRLLCTYTVSDPDFNGILTTANQCPGGGGSCADPTIEDIHINDLEFWIPDLDPDVTPTQAEIDAYPWAIWGGYDTHGIHIERIRIGNVPRGISLHGGDNLIRDIDGLPAYIGIEVDTAGSGMVIDNISFNDYWGGDPGEGPVSAIDQWMRENGIGCIFGRIDALKARDIQLSNRYEGIRFRPVSSPYDTAFWDGVGGGTGGFIDGLGLDNIYWGIRVTELGYGDGSAGRMSISNFYWSGRDSVGSDPSRFITVNSHASRTSRVTLHNGELYPAGSIVSGSTHAIYVVDGEVSASEVYLMDAGKFSQLDAGQLHLLRCGTNLFKSGTAYFGPGGDAGSVSFCKGFSDSGQIQNDMIPSTKLVLTGNMPL